MDIPETGLRNSDAIIESYRYQIEFLSRQNEKLLELIGKLVKEATYYTNQKGGKTPIRPVIQDEKTGQIRAMSEEELNQQMMDLKELGIL